jgi:ParB family chromosome partitioning protein
VDDFDDLLDGVSSGGKVEKELVAAKAKIVELEKAFSAVDSKSGEPSGKPLMVDINLVIEDPDKPNVRQDENASFEEWLTENIKEQKAEGGPGIQDPVSVRWSKEHQKWIINKGHTRIKCGKKAGLREVPILIQDESTDWNQVIENILRDGLTTKDTVAFIDKKKKEGISQKDIAKKLSRDAGWVSKHAALINPPTFVQTIWDNGYASDFSVLYGLTTAYKENPSVVEEEANKIISERQTITEDDVNAIKKAIKTPHTDEELGLNDNEDEEGSGGEDDSDAKKKSRTKLEIEFDGQTGYVVVKEPEDNDNLVVELESGGKMEVPISDITIVGIVIIPS